MTSERGSQRLTPVPRADADPFLNDFEVSNDTDLADVIESVLLLYPGRRFSTSQIQRVLSSQFQIEDSRLAFVLQTMRRRRTVLAERYPFEIVDGLAVIVDDQALASYYATLLFMTPDGVARAGKLRNPPPDMTSLFEEIVRDALRNMLGSGGRALRFGWSDVGRTKAGFSGAIEWLAEELGIRTGTAYLPPRRKDGGVDVVAWRPFKDNQTGFPIVLAQCTVQKNPIAKTADIELHQWRRWLDLDQPPQVVLAFPGTIRSTEVWKEMSAANLLLDRFRLCELLPKSHISVNVTEATNQYAAEIPKAVSGADDL